MNPYNIVPYVRYCILRQCYEGWVVNTRRIPDHELVLILGGKGSFTVEGVEYPVKKGMLFYFYPGLLHSAKTELDEPMRFLAVHFSFAHVEYSSDAWSIEPGNLLLPLQPVQQLKNHILPADTFHQLCRHWKEKLPGYELVTRALMQKLIYEIIEDLKQHSANFSAYAKVEKVIQYLQQHLHEKVKLSELCNLVNLSAPYLSQIFKQVTGHTIVRYHNHLRIDRAKDYLLEGNLKIKEISDILGFKDEFYFSRLFKQMEGVSPTDFYLKKIHEL